MPRKKQSRQPPPAKYSQNQQDILRFAQWIMLVAFVFFVIAAIITTSPRMMYYSVLVGLMIAYAIYKGWFDP